MNERSGITEKKRSYSGWPLRIMISGGGTGGHIYPAISIAQALEDMLQEVKILFVGANGKMEMEKVPDAGFEIVGLWIGGVQRSLSLQNLMLPFKIISSVWKSFMLVKNFRPDAVVGVGGYASGPLLYAAASRGVPTLIQEQNSYAGLTNKLLRGRVQKICVAHGGMEKYFPGDKLVITGNPVRETILLKKESKPNAYRFFNLDPEKKTLLIMGGSLGARSINEFVLAGHERLAKSDCQVVWQTGGLYFEEMKKRLPSKARNILVKDFVREMHYAYAVADVVISRAGALAIAELMLTGKPSVLVPSPNVAEDHQTVNAKALVERDAAVMVKDSEGGDKMLDVAMELLKDEGKREMLGKNIKSMSRANAAKDIAAEIVKLTA